MIQKVILVRHGQSIYNLENKFTGWKDVDLTEKGIYYNGSIHIAANAHIVSPIHPQSAAAVSAGSVPRTCRNRPSD